MKLFFRFILVTIAAFLIAVNIDSFIYSAHLLPGGFSGIVLLLQDIFEKYLNITIPYSLFYWLLNIAPAIMCFKFVGKKFTLLSIWMIISSGLFTDLLPHIDVTNDVVLCAVFGGLLQFVLHFLQEPHQAEQILFLFILHKKLEKTFGTSFSFLTVLSLQFMDFCLNGVTLCIQSSSNLQTHKLSTHFTNDTKKQLCLL